MKAHRTTRKAHPKCRPTVRHDPTVGYTSVLRLRDDNRWVRDNGDPGLAFVECLPGSDDSAIVWVADCKCATFQECPLSRALAFASRYGSATVVRRRPSRKPQSRRRKGR